jgi:hypothetical protein
MSSTFSTRRPQLPGEPLQAKAAHLTIGGCLAGSGAFLLWSAWDEFSCTAGERTSTGPCGIGVQASGAVLFIAVILLVAGAIVVWRGLRRRVDPDGSTGWRIGQGIAVMLCGCVVALMIPRLACPEGTHLSVVFRFCVSTTRSYPAPSTGFTWKVVALVAGLVLGAILLWWRSIPWPVATVIVVAVFAFTTGYAASRTTGLPWQQRSYTIGLVAAARAP